MPTSSARIATTGVSMLRLFRFDLIDDLILCELDEKQNIMHVNQYLFDQLPRHLQNEVFKTTTKTLRIDHLPNYLENYQWMQVQ